MSPDTGIVAVLRKGITDEEADRILADQCATARRLRLHGDVSVTVSAWEKHRSLDQNAMFRGLCRDISKAWNSTRNPQTSPEATARDLKVAYGIITTEYSPVSDKRQARIKSTTEYTAAEMSALIDATLAWAADNGIPLPDPRR